MRASAPTQLPERADVYDERNIQAKVLENWERQRAIWDGMKKRLFTRKSKGGRVPTAPENFTFAGPRNRERQEELGMIEAAVPLSALSSYYTWESMLRRENEADGMRYVQLGKSYFPYALFGELKDPTSHPMDHAVYTRVVAEDYMIDPLGTVDERTGRRVPWGTWKSRMLGTQHSSALSAAAAAAAAAAAMRGPSDPRDADLDEMEAALKAMGGRRGSNDSSEGNVGVDVLGSASTMGDTQRYRQPTLDSQTHLAATNVYYRKQLRAYAPFIEKRFAHFAVPRQFLAVEGTAAPMSLVDERDFSAVAAATANGADVEPVQYYPPPPPMQQRVAIPTGRSPPRSADTMTAGARRSTASPVTSALLATPPPNASGLELQKEPLPVSVRLSSVGEALAAACGAAAQAAGTRSPSEVDDNGMNNSRLLQSVGSGEGEAEGESAEQAASSHPSLELSTQRLFLHAIPGELAHAHITVRNTSAVTVYYSWILVDLVQEDIIDTADTEASGYSDDDEADEEGNEDDGEAETAGDAQRVKKRAAAMATLRCAKQTLHTMARHSAASRHYFRLANPTNGVFLPGEEERFPFSVRAPCAGRFKQRYELLTVPPSPTRIFVELIALVRAMCTSARALARPVAAALDARATRDSQRHLLQRLAGNDAPLDMADLLGSVRAVRQKQQDAVDKEEARRRAQREAWVRANAFTYDGIPYNRAVYDKLEKVWASLHTTLEALSPEATAATAASAERGNANREEEEEEPADPLARIDVHRWNGSINTLLAKLTLLRDAPSRNTLYDAVMSVLRVARAATIVDTAAAERSPRVAAEEEEEEEGEGEEGRDSEKGEREPLSELLRRAADALARQVESSRMAAYTQEISLLQLPLEPSIYAAGSGGAGLAGDRKKRTPSANSSKKGAGNSSSGGGAGSGGSGGGGGAPGSSNGLGGGPIVMGSLRAHLRESVVPRTADEERGFETEREEMIAIYARQLEEGHAALAQSYWQELSETIEAGCDLSLVKVVQAHRLEELRTIQTHEIMTVDSTAEVMPLKPVGTGNSGRKRGN